MQRPALGRTLALSLALALAAPAVFAQQAQTAAETAQSESQRLNAWFEQKYEEELRFSPIRLTFLGRKELYDRLDDMSEQAMDQQLAWHKATVAEMESKFDRDALDDEAKLSWDLWKLQYENAAESNRYRRNVYVFNQMQGAQSFLPTFLINFHKVETEADYLAYLSRLREARRAMSQMLELARRNADDGYRMPGFAYDGVLKEARAVVTGAPFDQGKDSALWADLQAKADALVKSGAIDEARATALKAQARQALLDNIQPGYRELIAWADADRA